MVWAARARPNESSEPESGNADKLIEPRVGLGLLRAGEFLPVSDHVQSGGRSPVRRNEPHHEKPAIARDAVSVKRFVS
jgi:hypothetical protein